MAHPCQFLTSARLYRRPRSNLPAVTMLADDEQDEEQRACINFEGSEVCGPVRYENGLALGVLLSAERLS